MSLSPVFTVDSPNAISEALKVLSTDGIFIFPTDTVYGIGCSVFQPLAIDKIYKVKGRDFNKALPILISDLDQISIIAETINNKTKNLMRVFWPGPLTIVVRKNSLLPKNLSPYDTVGIRMPNHSWLLNLIKISGPLASTSANLSGQPESRNIDEVLKSLDGKVNLIIDGGQSPSVQPSTVVDCHTEEIKILREGPIHTSEIIKHLSM